MIHAGAETNIQPGADTRERERDKNRGYSCIETGWVSWSAELNYTIQMTAEETLLRTLGEEHNG